jgi:putative membrane protein
VENISLLLLLFSVLGGYLLGIISGLLPGIHNNNFALLLVVLTPSLAEKGLPPFYIAVIIISNAVSQTFHDIIPSVFLGAPDSDTALAVLPGHRLLLDGAGAEAVRLSALGSAGSVVASLLFVVPLGLFFEIIYPYLEEHMALILISIVFLMLASEKGDQSQKKDLLSKYKYKFYALSLFLITGFLGLFVFSR